jgi:hypothetical protein
VRSAYHLQKEILVIDKGECSCNGQHSLIWKQLWKMKIPHVVKVFLGRSCHNALATKANLFKRKISEDHLCPLCDRSRGRDYGACSLGLPSCKSYMEFVWEED